MKFEIGDVILAALTADARRKARRRLSKAQMPWVKIFVSLHRLTIPLGLSPPGPPENSAQQPASSRRGPEIARGEHPKTDNVVEAVGDDPVAVGATGDPPMVLHEPPRTTTKSSRRRSRNYRGRRRDKPDTSLRSTPTHSHWHLRCHKERPLRIQARLAWSHQMAFSKCCTSCD